MFTDEERAKVREGCLYWKGTPYRHRSAVRGKGVDCVHFVVDCLKRAGKIDQSVVIPRYRKGIGMRGAEDILVREWIALAPSDIVHAPFEFGDVVFFEAKLCTNHIALVVDNALWHCLYTGTVDAYPMDDFRRSIKGAFRLK